VCVYIGFVSFARYDLNFVYLYDIHTSILLEQRTTYNMIFSQSKFNLAIRFCRMGFCQIGLLCQQSFKKHKVVSSMVKNMATNRKKYAVLVFQRFSTRKFNLI
jgi:hypothetical protein